MAKVITIAKNIRNHWKKSTFAAAALVYGVNYGKEKYEINKLMRTYCTEAATYGNVPQPVTVPLKKVLVILNPAANKRSALQTFEDYCAPILHLAGIAIEIVKTDSEGFARRYVEELETLPYAILVAGGDGTLSETITGLLRRMKFDSCPIGVLPVGRTNKFASELFNYTKSSNLGEVKGIANAAISVVRGKTQPKDVMKIEVLSENGDKPSPKPVYAIGSLQWGAFRDVLCLRDKYWYFGPLREYSAFVFNAFNANLTWKCTAKLTYTEPCNGCNNCYVKEQEKKRENRRWWSSFIPKMGSGSIPNVSGPDFSKVVNKDCNTQREMTVQPSELLLLTNANRSSDEIPKLSINLSNFNDSGLDFITKGWKRINSNTFEPNDVLDVRTVEIFPENLSTEENELFFSIDNEEYEVKPIKISLVPRAVNLFTL